MSLATPFRELAFEISAASSGSSQTVVIERKENEVSDSKGGREVRWEENDALFLFPTPATEAASRFWILRLESLATEEEREEGRSRVSRAFEGGGSEGGRWWWDGVDCEACGGGGGVGVA